LGEKNVVLRPEAFTKGEDPIATAQFSLERGDALTLGLPSAWRKIRRPNGFSGIGTCESAVVQFRAENGSWTASYSPLTVVPS